MPDGHATTFVDALRAALGDDAVSTGDAIPEAACVDWSGVAPVRPLARVRPRTTAEVAAVLALCTRHRVPVVPQGGLTGLAGGAIPTSDALALSTERMTTIDAVDVAGATVIADAGATLEAIGAVAAPHGLVLGVDFGARGSCQVGGAVSTNAGGHGVLQFGMMREQVLGIEVVLADGSVLPMLRPMIKNNTGYDLKQWFIGAEGTLGVVTRVLLRLHPAPRARVTMLAAIDDFDAALALLRALRARFGHAVAAFEVMWRDFVDTSLAWRSLRDPFAVAHRLLVLVEVDGDDEAALRESAATLLATEGLVRDAIVAQSHAQARALWTLREATADLPVRMHPPLNFDVSLPIATIGRFAHACRAALDARWPGHRTITFGHVGDGNLHVSTDVASIDGDAEGLERLVYALVAESGGSVSAEHGIGTHKKAYLAASRTRAEIDAMRAIRRALDPLGLMNPGKVFDP